MPVHPPPFPPSLPRYDTAASDWSLSTDLRLWFKCQESSPILTCTVVILRSDLVWPHERAAVLWMHLITALPQPPPMSVGGSWAHSRAFLFQSGPRVPKPWNSPLCGMTTMCNFIRHLEDWLFTMCVKYFSQLVISDSLTTVQFLSVEGICQSLYYCKYKNKSPIFLWGRQNIYNLFWDLFLCWF